MSKIRSIATHQDSKTSESQNPDHIVWDSDVTGLGKRHRNGRVTWVIQRRIDGKTRKKTLGPCEGMAVETARELALGFINSYQSVLNWGSLHNLKNAPKL